ncbi:MAG: Cadherin domain protein, partial [Planctomycetaceae bacterium]|nr:Cadherin domain protein [Planctomycetaceae bacterium]
GTNGSEIAGGLNGTATGQSYIWNPAGIPAGTYYVYGEIDDGINPPVFVYFPNSVTIANQAPVLLPLAGQTVNEGDTLTLNASATDPNGDSVVYSLATGAPDGVDIDPATGVFTWTPTEVEGPGAYTISVIASDTGTPPLSSSQSFQVTVGDVNSAPVLRKIFAQSVPKGGTFGFTVGADDSDLPVQTLRYSLDAGAPAGATIDPMTGVFSWTTAALQPAGDYPVTFRVTDNGGSPLSDAVTVNLTVTNASLPAVPGSLEFDVAAYTVDEGGNATITVSRTGGSSGMVAVQYGASSGSAIEGQDFATTSGILVFADGETSKSFVVPALHDSLVEGPETLTLSLTNPVNGSLGELQQAVLTINDVLSIAPVFTSSATFNVAENQTAVGTVTATDANIPTPAVNFSITGGADAAKFAISNTGTLTFKAGPDFESPADANGNNVYELQVMADDGVGGTAVQSISVTVTPVNDNMPVFTSLATFSVAENQTAVGTVVATDADLPVQTVTFIIDGGADASKFLLSSTGVLTFKVAPDFETPTDSGANNVYNLQIKADDGAGGTKSQNIAVTVTPVNDNSPVFTSPAAYNAAENQTAVGTVTATDADLPTQNLTFSITGGADAAQFAISNAGVLTFKSAPHFDSPTDADANNVYELQVTADDGNGGSTAKNISVTVTKVIVGPVISLSPTAINYQPAKKPVAVPVDAAASFVAGVPSPVLSSTKLIVSITSNHNSVDVLGLLAGTTNGLTLKGKKLTVGKTVIGTISGGKGKVADLTIAFTSAATSDLVQKTMEKITFSTKVAGSGPRTVSMHLTNVSGKNSNTATRQITLQ